MTQARVETGFRKVTVDQSVNIIPRPSPEIVEVHHILKESGFTVAPFAFVNWRLGTVTHAVAEVMPRPKFNGRQSYYANPDEDPFALRSRFVLTWQEAYDTVSKGTIRKIPSLEKIVKDGGISLRMPTKTEFISVLEGPPDEKKAWEYLDNKAFLARLVGGHRTYGDLEWLDEWRNPVTDRSDRVGFRLVAACSPQEIYITREFLPSIVPLSLQG